MGDGGWLDLFAGPGGWDVGAARLGIYPLGVELDEAACATREAAGHSTLRADVSALDPLDFRPCEGLIASPPCQAWSMAGKRAGERDKQHVIRCAHEIAAGGDTRTEHRARCEDERSMLVAEPLRFVRDLRPTLVAFEQVPPVLELWSLFAGFLEVWGYSVWTGVLEAERYGVPQTRERAILMASLGGPVAPPEPTHHRYVPGEPRPEPTVDLFGGGLEPWVSMADALGWGATEREVGSIAYRRTRGPGMTERHGDRRDHPASEPAPTLTTKAQSDEWVYDQRQNGATPRGGHCPAPTMLAKGLARGVPVWRYRNGNQANAAERDATAPAPTVHFGHALNRVEWVRERPASTEELRDVADDQSKGTIRVTVTEAAVLQSFPADYPWQGSKTAQFTQVGNAVPPLLAYHVLRALTGASELEAVA